ncbi:alanine racemase [bacterium]|nr:alanine racemase [bacterium]
MFTHRPTFARIDLDALEHNFRVIRRRLGEDIGIISVVKADAYGHGAVPIAANLERLGASGFAVAFCEEGVQLREGGITKPILVLGGIYIGEAQKASYYDLTPVLFSRENAEETAREVRRVGRRLAVHLKVDTGMNRIGMRPEEAEDVLRLVRESEVLDAQGLLTHLATVSPDLGDSYWRQVTAFRDVVDRLTPMMDKPQVHMANSAAVLAAPRPPFNAVRVGKAMLGAYPGDAFRGMLPLRPVLSLGTQITHLNAIRAGEAVSYEGTFVAGRETLVATIPMGYADGLNRKLSNTGEALVRGQRARIIGNVCMDMTMLDVTDIPGVAAGDPVVLIGRQGDGEINVHEVARHCGTIPYEIFTNINHRVARVYVKGQGKR